jgi:dTDP-4-dehydrorhamnose 3,5-epimerase
MRFRFQRLEIPEVVLVESQSFADGRGFFSESYKLSVFQENGILDEFVQDNHSRSVKGTLRGLHFQLEPRAQAKLVMVARGEIFDVAVDLRRGSPTYARWVGATLSADNHCKLYIPRGFAHGFCVLSEEADVLYKVSAEYDAELDSGVAWNDPQIGVDWPVEAPLLSTKDEGLPPLESSSHNFEYEGPQ